MSKQLRSRCAPRFEALEAKEMLAGDVAVQVVNGNLNILGDDMGNNIVITAGEEAGTYVITGRDGTTINAASSDGDPVNQITVEGVTRNVRIAMGDGDDAVRIRDASFRGNVSVATGAGEDTVLIGLPGDASGAEDDPVESIADVADGDPSVHIGRSLRIATGNDSDLVRVDSLAVRGNVAIATGLGDDTVRIGRPDATEEPSAAVEDDTTTTDRPTVRVGNAIRLSLGAGEDTASILDSRARLLNVSGGADSDSIAVDDSYFNAISIQGGWGEATDMISLRDVHARTAAIHTGGGADGVVVRDSAFGLLAVGLGAGDDTLTLDGVSARVGLFAGGPGEGDLLALLGENHIRHERAVGFELPEPVADETV